MRLAGSSEGRAICRGHRNKSTAAAEMQKKTLEFTPLAANMDDRLRPRPAAAAPTLDSNLPFLELRMLRAIAREAFEWLFIFGVLVGAVLGVAASVRGVLL